ncbi:hypothetical protein [Hymenobacter busanensis]|uniref:hypothetical protein n=1 Tax=Hymenobacter busanensis TaxID=2607656 RepID=UPI001246E935|nr:hypothetical protein [Hymenobacter busanensis]QHJ07460.1 hypothetical protein GUY19_09255 [Hymenobacter busanensis]
MRRRLVNLSLWLVLVGIPAGYCLLYIAADFHAYMELFAAGANLGNPRAIAASPSWEALQPQITSVYVPRTLLAFLGCAVLLLPVALLASVRRKKLVLAPTPSWLLAKQLLGLLLTYVLGSLAHLELRQFHLIRSSLAIPDQPNYFWPLELTPLLRGWTIYPPLAGNEPLLPDTDAACTKLGALIAGLAARYVWLRRSTLPVLNPLKQS